MLTSIGFGDVTPANRGEFLVSIVLMIMSSIFWAYTIGNFCSIVSTMDMHTITFRQRMDEVLVASARDAAASFFCFRVAP